MNKKTLKRNINTLNFTLYKVTTLNDEKVIKAKKNLIINKNLLKLLVMSRGRYSSYEINK